MNTLNYIERPKPPEDVEMASVFKTNDLNVSAYLGAKGHMLRGVEWKTPHKALFLFTDSPDLRKDVNGFWNGATINAKRFVAEQRLLKNLLHDSSDR